MTIDNITTDVQRLGADIDLLVRHDEWLEQYRDQLRSIMEENKRELQNIACAQRIKRRMREQDLVAVQKLIKDEHNNIVDITISIMKLPDAIEYLSTTENTTLDNINAAAQLYGLDIDGYQTN